MAAKLPTVGSRVVGSGGKTIGKVVAVAPGDANGSMSTFTVESGLLFGLLKKQKKQVPIRLVKHVGDGTVVLNVNRKQFADLSEMGQ